MRVPRNKECVSHRGRLRGERRDQPQLTQPTSGKPRPSGCEAGWALLHTGHTASEGHVGTGPWQACHLAEEGDARGSGPAQQACRWKRVFPSRSTRAVCCTRICLRAHVGLKSKVRSDERFLGKRENSSPPAALPKSLNSWGVTEVELKRVALAVNECSQVAGGS